MDALKKIGIIIQARTGSSRLSNKMILPFFKGQGIFEILLKRLVEAKLEVPIILATTYKSGDNVLELIALKYKIDVFRGSEDNVLERFINAAELYNVDKIIRVCADNPFLDIDALRFQINSYKEKDVDYWCYCKSDKTPTIKTHFGFWTEGVKLSTLKKIANVTMEKIYQEHVTNYIYTKSNKFNIYFHPINKLIESESHLRLTIDTKNDFELAKEIFRLVANMSSFNSEDLVKIVKTNPNWLDTMKNEILVNNK